MDIKKIIKEEINDFEWVKSIEPELKTFVVRYRSEMVIDAYTFEEAEEIYRGLNLNDIENNINHDTTESGVRSNDWYDTTSFEEE